MKNSSFYKTRFDSFFTHLSNAKQLGETEIHKLRVDIKYIRGLLLLLEGQDINNDIVNKLLKQIGPVFKSLGKLRAVQVCKALIVDSPSGFPPEVLSTIERKNNKYTQQIKKSLAGFNTDKFHKKLDIIYDRLDESNKREIRSKADEIIHNAIDLMYKLWASSRGDENFHEVRKSLKTIKTLLQLLLFFKEDDKLKEELDIVNETETILGDWHDRHILNNKLSNINTRLITHEHKTTFRELKSHNRQEKNKLEDAFRKKMRTHFSNF